VAKTDWSNLSTRSRGCRAILKRANWAVREYEPGDETQILELCQRVLGFTVTAAEWHWRMFQNPAGKAVSQVASLKESGRIVGHLAAVPVDLKVGGFSRKLFFLVESVVDPAYQGRGIHAVLTITSSNTVAERSSNFIGGLPNPRAHAPNLKLGGTPIFTAPIYFKILNLGAVVRVGLHSNVLARIAGFLAQPFLQPKPVEKSSSFTLEKVQCFNGKVDQLWNRVGQRFGICANRTSNLLNWRYFKRPDSAYTVFSISSGNSWMGYIVLRSLDKWGLRLGTVVDFFFDPECAVAGKLLLRCAEKHFRDNGADVLWGLFVCPPVYRKTLRQAGFLKAPSLKGVRQFHFVVDFVSIDSIRPDLLQRDGPLLRQGDQWFFSLGDTDLA
jgi:predicted N-acetyltransferase YhbS